MDVVPSRESSVININYKGADPRFAAFLKSLHMPPAGNPG